MQPRSWIIAGVSLALVLAGVFAAVFLKAAIREVSSPDEGLSALGVVPAFVLLDQNGREAAGEALKGQVWVANFIFTHCAGPCPLLSRKMRDLQDAVEPTWPVRLVSFSVDPDRDTPPVLLEYAARYGAIDDRWWFLTGDTPAVYNLIRDGFQVALDEDGDSDQIIHSLRLVLVDGAGRIRKIYNGLEEGVVERMLPDIRRLVDEARQGV